MTPIVKPPKPCARVLTGSLCFRLELIDPGCDFSVVSAFRQRLLAGGQEEGRLTTLVHLCRERGYIRERGKQRDLLDPCAGRYRHDESTGMCGRNAASTPEEVGCRCS
jgi:hypothetical protein